MNLTGRPIFQKGEKHAKAKRRQESPRHLEFVRSLPCLLCWSDGSDPHHLLRIPESEARGMGMRTDDKWTIPLCRTHHDALHATGNEIAYLGSFGVYGPAVAALLWDLSGKREEAERAMAQMHQLVRLHGITEPLRSIRIGEGR